MSASCLQDSSNINRAIGGTPTSAFRLAARNEHRTAAPRGAPSSQTKYTVVQIGTIWRPRAACGDDRVVVDSSARQALLLEEKTILKTIWWMNHGGTTDQPSILYGHYPPSTPIYT